MKTRTITGVCYVAVIIGLVVLKWLVPDWGAIGFDVLFCAIAVLGCFEFIRAAKVFTGPQKIITYFYCAAAIPLYAVLAYLRTPADVVPSYAPVFASLILFGLCALVSAVVFVISFDSASAASLGWSYLAMLYCGVLPLCLSALNHLGDNSTFAIIYLFVEVMLTDSCAYLLGMALHKKLPKKMAPKVSPNKTLIGGLGGIIGAVAGGVACYYVFAYWLDIFTYTWSFPAVALIILFSAVLGFVIQAGDLFESAIKRKCGVKDMGRLLPGHGGVLDRFDSMLFTSPVIYLMFLLIALFI
ncbi:MAG: phosphatidate cytidylyltransferase [Clostridia bacterium]|nr:phosphatidate cytidylyltransferase [Clostridia bacterium]